MRGRWRVHLTFGIRMLSGLVVVGCAGTRTPAPVRSSGNQELPTDADLAGTEGVIYLAGNAPQPLLSLKDDGGSVYQLAGPLAGELRRLAGARVKVTGPRDSTAFPPSIQAIEYLVLGVDGRRPWVGELRAGSGGLWLLTPDSVAVEEPTGRLEALVGGKVWVVADTSSRPALVQSFGVLREPGS
jgi:hypothetical protein